MLLKNENKKFLFILLINSLFSNSNSITKKSLEENNNNNNKTIINFHIKSKKKSNEKFSNKKNFSKKNFNRTLQNSFISNFQCRDNSSCNNHGVCLNSTHCLCEPYFTTFINEKSNKEKLEKFRQCNYNQIGKKNIFLISFFFGPMSFEHLIMGNIILGVLKLSIPMILILSGNLTFMYGKFKEKEELQICGKFLEIFSVFVLIIWWFIDWVCILLDVHRDFKSVKFYDDL